MPMWLTSTVLFPSVETPSRRIEPRVGLYTLDVYKRQLQNSAYDAFVHETYTQVPDETRQALSDILSELVGEEDADPYQYIPVSYTHLPA